MTKNILAPEATGLPAATGLLCWRPDRRCSAVAPELAGRIRTNAWARTLGIEFIDILRGYCRLRLRLQAHMVNFRASARWLIFSLAAVAFARGVQLARQPAVALSVTIDYLAAVTAE